MKLQLQSVFESNGTLSDFTRAALFLKQIKKRLLLFLCCLCFLWLTRFSSTLSLSAVVWETSALRWKKKKTANLFLCGEGIRSAEASQPATASYSLAEGSGPCGPWTGPLCPRAKASHLCNLPGLLELHWCTLVQLPPLFLFVCEKLKNLYSTAGKRPAKRCFIYSVAGGVGFTSCRQGGTWWKVQWVVFGALWWYKAVLLTKSVNTVGLHVTLKVFDLFIFF